MDPADNRTHMPLISRLHVPLDWSCPLGRVSAVTQILFRLRILYCLGFSQTCVDQGFNSSRLYCEAVRSCCYRVDGFSGAHASKSSKRWALRPARPAQWAIWSKVRLLAVDHHFSCGCR